MGQQEQDLLARLTRVEDELAVRNLVVRYGMAADCGDTETAVACHLGDARYIVSAPRAGRSDEGGEPEDLVLEGHAAIREMLNSDLHQSLLPNCGHTVGPLVVEVEGERARVAGYSRLYRRMEETFPLMRMSVNEWHLVKRDQRWFIESRESRLLGEEQAQAILRRAPEAGVVG